MDEIQLREVPRKVHGWDEGAGPSAGAAASAGSPLAPYSSMAAAASMMGVTGAGSPS